MAPRPHHPTRRLVLVHPRMTYDQKGNGKGFHGESARRRSDPEPLPGQSRWGAPPGRQLLCGRLTSASSRPCPQLRAPGCTHLQAPPCGPLLPKRNHPRESKEPQLSCTPSLLASPTPTPPALRPLRNSKRVKEAAEPLLSGAPAILLPGMSLLWLR